MKLQFTRKFDNGWYEALWNFSISRLAMVLVTILAVSRFARATASPKFIPPYDCIHHINRCFKAWWEWDVGHYLYIAQHGYQPDGRSDYFPPRTAFFPLWPFLLRLVASPFGKSATIYYLVGIVLSSLLFYFSLVLIYHLVQEEFGAGVAKKAIFLLAFSPYSLFFSVGYTESLFLLLMVGAFFFLRCDQWLLAGVCGYLAALTRPTGIVLTVPFFILLIQRVEWRRLLTRDQLRREALMIGGTLLIPAGLLTYMIYLKFTFGDPLYFARWEHQEWLRTTTWPWTAIVQSIQALFNPGYPFDINFNNLLFVILPLVALAIGWRRIPLHYSLFVLALAIGALVNPVTDPMNTLASIPRYIFVAFPLFVIFAQWAQRPRAELVLNILFITYFLYNVMLFSTRGWVA